MSLIYDRFRQSRAELWANPDSFGTTLVVATVDDLGMDCLDYEPETINEEILQRYGVVIPEHNKDRFWAMVTVLTTDLFYNNLEVFHQVCNSLNGAEADFHLWNPVEPEEAAWAMTEVLLNDPPGRNEKFHDKFNEEIKEYVRQINLSENIISPPSILNFSGGPQADQPQSLEDPEMQQAFAIASTRKSDYIRSYLKEHQQGLLLQLQTLPVLHRDRKSWSAFLERVSRGSRKKTAAVVS